MTMPEPSRSRPRFDTEVPSGLMKVLTRTTAETRSSSVVACAGAADNAVSGKDRDQDDLKAREEPMRKALRMTDLVRMAVRHSSIIAPQCAAHRRP